MDFGLLLALLMDFGGFLISLFSIFIIAESTSVLIPTLRRGVLNLMWGLGFISLAFCWRVLNNVTPTDFFRWGDALMLLLGVTLLFLAALNLFHMYNTKTHAV